MRHKAKVLQAANIIKTRLEGSNRLIRGYNDCFALALVFTELVTGEQPRCLDWMKIPMRYNRDFERQIILYYDTEDLLHCLESFMIDEGYKPIYGDVPFYDGDIIIRRTEGGFATSIAVEGKEISVDENTLELDWDMLPLLDRTIVSVARMEE